MKEIRSKSGLAVALSRLKGFEKPKVSVEQYIMDSEIGALVLWQAALKGDIGSGKGKVSADLGCGTGILGIGCLLLGESEVYFVDNDENALDIAKENLKIVQSEFSVPGKAIFRCMGVSEFSKKVGVVVQNPPFGVKVRHADRIFLKKAMEIGKVIYSFHKSGSEKFVRGFVDEKNFKITDKWNFEYPLKASYSFHSRRIKRINVDCYRIEKME